MISRIISLAERSFLISEAVALEVWHGQNPYSEFLRRNGRRPDPDQAETIGILMSSRVLAADGKKYPRRRRGDQA